MTTDTTALAALFLGPGQPLELIRAAIPTPGAGETLVRVECCAVCSSDLHTHAGRRAEPTPTVLGHEIVGRVMSFGPGAQAVDARGDALAAGDRVTWTVAASCGKCVNCRDGLDQKCAALVKYGHERVSRDMPFRGGLAEVVLLSAGTGIVKLPEGADAGVMALANCSTATVAAALRTGFARRNRPGLAVAVLGAGVLGLTACAMARRKYAAGVVIAVDRDAARARAAMDFGATHTCTDLLELETLAKTTTGGVGVDVAVELAGTVHTARAALAIARTGGTVVLAGTTLPTDPLIIEPQSLVRRLLRIEGVHNYVTADLITAVDFLLGEAAGGAAGGGGVGETGGAGFPFASLIAARYPLEEVAAAFARGHDCAGRRVAVMC